MMNKEYIKNRIEGYKEELKKLFKDNNLSGSILELDYLDYVSHLEIGKTRHNPYLDNRIKFSGKRKLKEIITDLECFINQINK